jgi:hypothetical protein
MNTPYTRGDSFSCGASREHIARALADHGATDVRISQRGNLSAIAFRGTERQFRIMITLPPLERTTPVRGSSAQSQTRDVSAKTVERATRKMWHAMALAIDAKLAAVAAGAGTLESEFLAHVVLPGNRTVLDELEPVIAAAYRSGLPPSFSRPAPSPDPALDAQTRL